MNPTLTSHPLQPVAHKDVVIDDAFWSPRLQTLREVTLPDVLNKFEQAGALANFDRVRDRQTGGHAGPPWYDGLVYETMRAAADMLTSRRDAALEARLDGMIERITAAAADDPNGYLNTYTQLEMPACRFGQNGGNQLYQHDIYNAGALIEAAVHYYRATGKMALLKAAARYANHMADVMGPAPKKNIVPEHPLPEEALIKLHLLFREQPALRDQMGFSVDAERTLRLVEFWLEHRGDYEGRAPLSMPPCGAAYAQDHQPLLQQESAEGHAVRAALLYTGLASAALVNGHADYYRAALTLWDNAVHRKMHITGSVGSNQAYEGFGPDYYLPNDAYLETCAAVGMGFFHHTMALAFANGCFADELERTLYNGVLTGVSIKGDTYFYENPLETDGRERWDWHGCPCCPPMLLKILSALGGASNGNGNGGTNGRKGVPSPDPSASPTPTLEPTAPPLPYVVKQIETLGGEAISGNVCSVTQPFSVLSRTPRVTFTFIFGPQDAQHGKVSYTYSIPKAGESHDAAGTYSLSPVGKDGTLQLSLSVSDHVVFKGFDGNIPLRYKFNLVPSDNTGCPAAP